MIYLSGDTHGNIDFHKLKAYFKRHYTTQRDVLIILGDAGIVWSERECFIWDYSTLGPTVLFIDGNHENFDLLKQFPVCEIFGAKAHYLGHNVYHIFRGEVLHINGLSFLCLGGATSIDREYREEGVTWWNDEHISEGDLRHALETGRKESKPFDYVLTHCGPSSIVKRMFGYLPDQDSEMLTELAKGIDFKHWIFGHYHADRKWGAFECLYNKIIEIPAMDTGRRIPKQNVFCRTTRVGYLANGKTFRKTKMTVDDLPEWYYNLRWNDTWYYNLKNVKDIAFVRARYGDPASKGALFCLSYKGKMRKTKSLRPVNEEEWDVRTYEVHIGAFLRGLEKYSPQLNLNGIKAQINLAYDEYNNRGECHFEFNTVARPYPEIKTAPFKDGHSGRQAQFEVCLGGIVLCTFIDKDVAQSYISSYFKNVLGRVEPVVCYENGTETHYRIPHSSGSEVVLRSLIPFPIDKEEKQ